MNRFLMLVIIIFNLNNQLINSQIWEINVGVEILETNGTYLDIHYDNIIFESKELLYVVSFGVNIPIYKITDEIVFGTQLNIDISSIFTTIYGNYLMSDLSFGLPGYLTLRYGGGSQKKSDKIFGAGIGIGYQYKLLISDDQNADPDAKMFAFGTPVFMAEIGYDRSHKAKMFDKIKIRFESLLGYAHKNYSFSDGNINYNYFYDARQTKLTIVFYF